MKMLNPTYVSALSEPSSGVTLRSVHYLHTHYIVWNTCVGFLGNVHSATMYRSKIAKKPQTRASNNIVSV
jgi:hypothetical protein